MCFTIIKHKVREKQMKKHPSIAIMLLMLMLPYQNLEAEHRGSGKVSAAPEKPEENQPAPKNPENPQPGDGRR